MCGRVRDAGRRGRLGLELGVAGRGRRRAPKTAETDGAGPWVAAAPAPLRETASAAGGDRGRRPAPRTAEMGGWGTGARLRVTGADGVGGRRLRGPGVRDGWGAVGQGARLGYVSERVGYWAVVLLMGFMGC